MSDDFYVDDEPIEKIQQVRRPPDFVTGLVCDACGEVFDPIACRWLCPNPGCRQKASCCEGAPLPVTVLDELVAG